MSLSKYARRILSSKAPEAVILEDAGYITPDLKLTDDGKLALFHVVFEKYEAQLVEAAKDLIARRDAKK